MNVLSNKINGSEDDQFYTNSLLNNAVALASLCYTLLYSVSSKVIRSMVKLKLKIYLHRTSSHKRSFKNTANSYHAVGNYKNRILILKLLKKRKGIRF